MLPLLLWTLDRTLFLNIHFDILKQSLKLRNESCLWKYVTNDKWISVFNRVRRMAGNCKNSLISCFAVLTALVWRITWNFAAFKQKKGRKIVIVGSLKCDWARAWAWALVCPVSSMEPNQGFLGYSTVLHIFLNKFLSYSLLLSEHTMHVILSLQCYPAVCQQSYTQ